LELTLFFAAALAFCVKDISAIRRDGIPRDVPLYLAALGAVVCAGAALILRIGKASVIQLAGDMLNWAR
jgi:hypothetical protein